MEAAKEFLRRNEGNKVPVLTSACPGWIHYAETSHGEFILPFISEVKSPQQVMGSLVKRYFSRKLKILPSKIFHTTVMPCIDKRREASRDQFFEQETNSNDVDFVLTSKDLLKLILEKSTQFKDEEISPIDPVYNNIDLTGNFYSVGGGPSDGYLEYIFKRAALELYGVKINSIHYTFNTKTKDFKETSLEFFVLLPFMDLEIFKLLSDK
jgi:iron only hydrogenase large subunit-like protein